MVQNWIAGCFIPRIYFYLCLGFSKLQQLHDSVLQIFQDSVLQFFYSFTKSKNYRKTKMAQKNCCSPVQKHGPSQEFLDNLIIDLLTVCWFMKTQVSPGLIFSLGLYFNKLHDLILCKNITFFLNKATCI